ncbi:unnamed protein product [Rotaria sp. Silwood2]|nr:unnamed protein product [Rotaria sp. Silwood2]
MIFNKSVCLICRRFVVIKHTNILSCSTSSVLIDLVTCGDEDNACYVFSANTNKTSGAYGAMFKGNY